MCKGTLHRIIEDGHDDVPLPLHGGEVVVPYRGLAFVAAPSRDEHFIYRQIYDAVSLLQLREADRGHGEEMWAYVFADGKRVGEVSAQVGWRGSSEERNMTFNVIASGRGPHRMKNDIT